jgi:hypothetical protein
MRTEASDSEGSSAGQGLFAEGLTEKIPTLRRPDQGQRIFTRTRPAPDEHSCKTASGMATSVLGVRIWCSGQLFGSIHQGVVAVAVSHGKENVYGSIP